MSEGTHIAENSETKMHTNFFRTKFSEGPKGGRRKGGRGRKLSRFSFCCAFRCCVVYSPCFPVWGEEKVMTIYDAGPLAAGPLCGLLNFLNTPRGSGISRQSSRDIAGSSLPNPRKTNFRGRARTFRWGCLTRCVTGAPALRSVHKVS